MTRATRATAAATPDDPSAVAVATKTASRTPIPPGAATTRNPTTHETTVAKRIARTSGADASRVAATSHVAPPMASQAGTCHSSSPRETPHLGTVMGSSRRRTRRVQGRDAQRQQHQHGPVPAALPSPAGRQCDRRHQDGRQVRHRQRQHRAAVADAGRDAAAAGHLPTPHDRPDPARHILAQLPQVVPVQRLADRGLSPERGQAAAPAEADDEHRARTQGEGGHQGSGVRTGNGRANLGPCDDQSADDEGDTQNGDDQADVPKQATHRLSGMSS
jgi:hypothetical protein